MFFPEVAHAQTAPAAAEGGVLITILPLLLMIAVFYFLVMRPQIKREQARQKMRGELNRGDNVITSGGVIGKITKLEDESYVLAQIAEGTEVRLARASIEGVVETSIPKAKAAGKTSSKASTKKAAQKTGQKTSGRKTKSSSSKQA